MNVPAALARPSGSRATCWWYQSTGAVIMSLSCRRTSANTAPSALRRNWQRRQIQQNCTCHDMAYQVPTGHACETGSWLGAHNYHAALRLPRHTLPHVGEEWTKRVARRLARVLGRWLESQWRGLMVTVLARPSLAISARCAALRRCRRLLLPCTS